MTEAILKMAFSTRRQWLDQYRVTKDDRALAKANDWERIIMILNGVPAASGSPPGDKALPPDDTAKAGP